MAMSIEQTRQALERSIDDFSLEAPAFIADYRLEDFVTRRLGRYDLIAVTSDQQDAVFAERWRTQQDESGRPYFAIHMQGEFGLVLVYRDKPQAIVGFDVESESAAFVGQIQGIKPIRSQDHATGRKVYAGSSRGLYGVQWTDAMVSVLCAHLRRSDIPIDTLRILSAVKHPSVTDEPVDDNAQVFTFDQALKIYDGTAERLGFTQDKDQNYSLRL